MSDGFKKTATISIEEYDELRRIRDSEGKILADKLAELDRRAEKITWGRRFGVSYTYFGDFSDTVEYIGKDEAIRRLTDKITELSKPRPEPEPEPEVEKLPIRERIRILFTGIVD